MLTLAAGTCTVTAAQGGSQDFAFANLPIDVRGPARGKGQQSIAGFTGPGRAVAGVPFVVSAQATSGLAVSFRAGAREVTARSATPPVCTVSGATVIPLTGGTCTVIAFQAGSFQSRTLQAGSGPGSRVTRPPRPRHSPSTSRTRRRSASPRRGSAGRGDGAPDRHRVLRPAGGLRLRHPEGLHGLRIHTSPRWPPAPAPSPPSRAATTTTRLPRTRRGRSGSRRPRRSASSSREARPPACASP